ncbi:MAG TPA: amidohydrolase family protein [Vicinamibacterales bacterium]|nr:amidohydrolase family protein [Vicinamibacterales bacterium]
MTRILPFLLAAAVALASFSGHAQSSALTIKARRVIDGKGGVIDNAMVTVENGKITSVGPSDGTAIIDLGDVITLLPGFIDTHVHLDWHFNAEGRYHSGPEPPEQNALYAAENGYVTLMAGFTTVQSVGSPRDKAVRDAFARGVLPGPRVLSSLGQITNPKMTPDEMRAEVRKKKAEGADLVKIFASASIRDGGVPTLSQEQLNAACGEAKAQGLRSMVHAHSPESMVRAARAGCTVVEHGGLATPEALKELADRGVYFDPNIGLVTQNYLENKKRFLGIGNYTEEGFASMEKALGSKDAMFSAALKTPNLKIVMGTDAVAGAHGQNLREVLERVKSGQKPMDAILSLTSISAASMNMDKEIGAIAPGMAADLVGVVGNPLTDIRSLRRVTFVMKGGTVFRGAQR